MILKTCIHNKSICAVSPQESFKIILQIHWCILMTFKVNDTLYYHKLLVSLYKIYFLLNKSMKYSNINQLLCVSTNVSFFHHHLVANKILQVHQGSPTHSSLAWLWKVVKCGQAMIFFYHSYLPFYVINHYIHQASFDHVKVGPTLVLELHNLWRQIHMFLDILEFRVENQKK